MNLLDIVTHTPFWAWGILALLLVLGLSSTRDRVVSTPRLVLMPLVILGLAISNLWGAAGSLYGLAGAALGLAAGVGAGLAIESRAGTERVRQGVLQLRGEWLTLVVLLAIYLVRYTTIVVSTVNPALATGDAYHLVTALLSAFFAALTLARTGLRLRLAYSA